MSNSWTAPLPPPHVDAFTKESRSKRNIIYMGPSSADWHVGNFSLASRSHATRGVRRLIAGDSGVTRASALVASLLLFVGSPANSSIGFGAPTDDVQAGGNRMEGMGRTIKQEIEIDITPPEVLLIPPREQAWAELTEYHNPFENPTHKGLYREEGKTLFSSVIFCLRMAVNLPTIFMKSANKALVYEDGELGELRFPDRRTLPPMPGF
ncbi:hypothetical protein C8R45DRAFT_1146414 [Mycena sanguinolenta]|nr:hypothetical protein C8R45DRAFT_1146414 [Mycena sanguinolenta]